MPNYRRVFLPGGTFFFSVITFDRRPILTSEFGIIALRKAFSTIQKEHPFKMETVVILPDHLHCIWELPQGDSDFSLRWKMIKTHFTKSFLNAGGEAGYTLKKLAIPGDFRVLAILGGHNGFSRQKKGEKAVWQRRFWEHMIRDEVDLSRHIDYIHFNPVKHGFVNNPIDWKWSSFPKYVEKRLLPRDWGMSEPERIYDLEETGE